MPTPEIQAQRTSYFNRLTEHTEAQRTGGDVATTKLACQTAGYDYLQALIAYYKNQSQPSIEGLGEPLIIQYRIGDPEPADLPMIMQFNVGDPRDNGAGVPSPYDPTDPAYIETVQTAPHCYITEWDTDCQAIYDEIVNPYEPPSSGGGDGGDGGR